MSAHGLMAWLRCGLVVAAALAVKPSMAQTYPSRSITIVVPTAAGGGADALARSMARNLSVRLGQPVIIENKPGGNNQIAAQYVAKASPDGYTLLFAPESTFVINPYLYSALHYDPSNDFVPISALAAVYQVLAAHPSLAARSVNELVTLAKASPRSLNYGTFGPGSAAHLNMEAFQAATGMQFTPVHYRGAAPALADVVAGHISLMFVAFGSTIELWKTGQIKVLAIGRSNRLDKYPDLPTIAENGLPDFESKSWFGLFAPSRTPSDIVMRINAEIQSIFSSRDFVDEFLNPNSMEAIAGAPTQLNDRIRTESMYWQALIKKVQLKIE